MKTFIVTVRWSVSSDATASITYTQTGESGAEIAQTMSDGVASGGLVQLIGPDGVTAFLATRFIDMTIREQGGAQ